MKSCIITGLMYLAILGVTASNDFRYVHTEDGLPDGEINSIVQDSTGNMWLATWSGLVRYDGYSFELFRPELGKSGSLPEKKIKQLFITSDNNLWIATSMNLCRFIPSSNTFHTYRFHGIGNRGINITHLNEVENNLVVHAVEGIFLLPLAEIKNPRFMGNEHLVTLSGQPGNIYFNYSKGAGSNLILVRNEIKSSQIYITSVKNRSGKILLQTDTVFHLNETISDIEYVAADNTLHIATPNGIFLYSLEKRSFLKNHYFQGYDIRQLFHASNNRMYVALREPQLLYLDLHTGLTGKYESNPYKTGYLLDNEIHTMYEDFSGNLWIGHQGQGISILNLYKKKFFSYYRDPFEEISLNSNTVMCFGGTENELIIGCRSNGLNIVPKNQTTGAQINYTRIPFTPENASGTFHDGIWDIAKQNDSLFWIGTEQGLYSLQKTSLGWVMKPFKGTPNITHSIRKIFIDSNNNIWCGSHGFGLFFIPNPAFNEDGLNFQYESIPENPTTLSDGVILDIFLDSRKRFWIGTNNGFNKLTVNYENLDLSGKIRPELKFKRYIATQPLVGFLNNNEINCFFENYDGTIWIATQGGGINILNPSTDEFRYLTTSDGLPSNDVIAMVSDEDGYLWISTNKGLVRYNRFHNQPSFSAFSSSDGLQGEIFMINSYYKAPDGQLFFGGDKGFTSFYPREIKLNEFKPKISFTQLRIKNRLVNVGDTLYKRHVLKAVLNETEKIILPFRDNVFSIGTSALHFQNPETNSIVYKLEGIHNNWITIPATIGNIYLSNIPHGNYVLRTKAISSDGIYSTDEKRLEIEVKPPWYETGISLILFVIIFLMFIYGIVYFLIYRQRVVYKNQIDAISIQNNEQKMLFLTNIAHELRTPLSLIIAPIEDLVHQSRENSPWREHLDIISRNSKYLLRLINQIIDFRKLNAGKLTFQPHKADIVEVVKNVALNFRGYGSSRNISLHMELPEGSIIGTIDVQKFEEILYNLISNAFKHTYDNGSITVSLELSENEASNGQKSVHLSVFNEGMELDEEQRDRVFERFYKVDESTEGAGIGLSFSKSLVEMHQGTINVESLQGKGVVFHIIIPVGEVEIRPHEKDIENVFKINPGLSATKPANYSNGHETVLIVEDNSELRDFLVKIFSRNYSCFSAANGLDAWDIIQQDLPSLIISDIIIPGLNGLNLCRKVKENKNTCHIPVLLLTAKDAPDQITEGFSVGADSYVTKPFDIDLLMSQSARLIQNRELIKEKYRTQNFMIEVQNGNSSRDEEFVKTVRRILSDRISDPELNVNTLSRQLNISTTQLYRKLKELTGYSPVEFIRTLKLQKAYELLDNRSNTVKEVCYLTGFNNMSYFIKCFREHFGITPAHFRDKGMLDKSNKTPDNLRV